MTESERAIPANPALEPRSSPPKQAIRQASIEATERTAMRTRMSRVGTHHFAVLRPPCAPYP
jgi:hypothetical protein